VTMLFMVWTVGSFAQISGGYESYAVAGIQVKMLDAIPYEFSYTKINYGALGYSVKGGYGQYHSGDSYGGRVEASNGTTLNQRFSVNHSAKAFFVRGGLILPCRRRMVYTRFFSLNTNISYAYHRLEFLVNNNVTDSYRENRLYLALEVEHTWLYDISKSFQRVVPGFNNTNDYTPAQGVGDLLYVNATFGFHFLTSNK
jgi:hypothetical protein